MIPYSRIPGREEGFGKSVNLATGELSTFCYESVPSPMYLVNRMILKRGAQSVDYSIKHRPFAPEPIDQEDDFLVAAAKQNRAAFTPIYRRYAERVYRYVYSKVGNAPEAEDLTAQVFYDALVALPGYRPRNRFSGWLFTIAYRRCADYHRQPIPEVLSETVSSGVCHDPAEIAMEKESFARLEQLLGELDEESHELLRLHYAAGLTYGEMGEVLGRREGAIKMAMSRLIQKLKLRWEVQHD
jgi:RNA polymerase sigma-70 factor (ECF subfamily)